MPNSTNHAVLRDSLLAVGAILLFACTAISQLSERDRGIALYLDREYAQVVEVLTPVLVADREDKKVCLYLALAHFKLKNTDAVQKVKTECSKILTTYRQPSDEIYDSTAKTTKRPLAKYTREARTRRISGEVELLVEVRSDGQIGTIIIIRELPAGLTERALKAARKIKFKPAVRNGSPVDDIIHVFYHFTVY